MTPRLGVNIDHVATIRNARGGGFPDPVRAAELAAHAGADGITAHLREDRRHIGDGDISRLVAAVDLPLNLEMAATGEMLEIALRHRPAACCLVPEKREELTTEGGLDAVGGADALRAPIAALKEAGICVSLFIDPDKAQCDAAHDLGADVVELHTGTFCAAHNAGDKPARAAEFARLEAAAEAATGHGLGVHAGHGLDYATAADVAAIPSVAELNIGHFLIGEAIFCGLGEAIAEMRRHIGAVK